MKSSDKTPLKQQLQQQYKQVQLNDSQFKELEEIMNKQHGGAVETEEKRPQWRLLAIASMLLVSVLSTYLLTDFSNNNFENMPQLIAEEVVNNHLHLKPLEVKASSLDKLKGYFTKLNFMPVASRLAALDSLQLLGGRYCSLQGITAAQLRMKKGDDLQTLYQTEYLADVFGELPVLEKGQQPLVVYAKGIMVKIWVEKGLLFALTD